MSRWKSGQPSSHWTLQKLWVSFRFCQTFRLVDNKCWIQNFQSLNDPQIDCLTSDSYCVAAMQQKSSPTAENLRNLPAKQIPLDLEFVGLKKRPHNYISKSLSQFDVFDLFSFKINFSLSNFHSFSLWRWCIFNGDKSHRKRTAIGSSASSRWHTCVVLQCGQVTKNMWQRCG